MKNQQITGRLMKNNDTSLAPLLRFLAALFTPILLGFLIMAYLLIGFARSFERSCGQEASVYIWEDLNANGAVDLTEHPIVDVEIIATDLPEEFWIGRSSSATDETGTGLLEISGPFSRSFGWVYCPEDEIDLTKLSISVPDGYRLTTQSTHLLGDEHIEFGITPIR